MNTYNENGEIYFVNCWNCGNHSNDTEEFWNEIDELFICDCGGVMEDGWENEEPEYNYYVEKDENGYTAICPELDGCFTQGDSEKEVVENIEDAIFLHLQDRGISTNNVSRIKRTKKRIVIKKPDNDESLN